MSELKKGAPDISKKTREGKENMAKEVKNEISALIDRIRELRASYLEKIGAKYASFVPDHKTMKDHFDKEKKAERKNREKGLARIKQLEIKMRETEEGSDEFSDMEDELFDLKEMHVFDEAEEVFNEQQGREYVPDHFKPRILAVSSDSDRTDRDSQAFLSQDLETVEIMVGDGEGRVGIEHFSIEDALGGCTKTFGEGFDGVWKIKLHASEAEAKKTAGIKD